jgi:hypothetical protein
VLSTPYPQTIPRTSKVSEMSDSTQGQQNRKEIRQQIESVLKKYVPETLSGMANLIAYDFNLSPYTLKYNYIPMFIKVGILEYDGDNLLVLSAKGKKIQTTKDGLSEKELQEELIEENENRNKLGKPRLSLEEWKKLRSKRMKPLSEV